MDTFRLKQKRDRLVEQVRDHLDFLAGSISSKGLKWEGNSLADSGRLHHEVLGRGLR